MLYKFLLLLVVLSSLAGLVRAQTTLHIDLAAPTRAMSPTLYGLMTEEINHSFEGGLYAELIRNPAMKDPAYKLDHWDVVKGGGEGSIALEKGIAGPTPALNASLRMDITQAAANGGMSLGVMNTGYWGIPVLANTTYQVSFYAKAAPGFTGSLRVALERSLDEQVWAETKLGAPTGEWKKYTCTLQTGAVKDVSGLNRFVLSASGAGQLWLTQISLFPPTYHNRPKGNRVDMMEKLAAMHPTFLRFPGGSYLDPGHYEWKKAVGPADERMGHLSEWKYWSSDAMGLLEFLLWCEELQMEPVLCVSDGRGWLPHEGDVGGLVQDALDEIEYVSGDVRTPWGARRAADGHPKPFVLHYVEVGNEDYFDSTFVYEQRFARFFDAIKAKHPGIQVISTIRNLKDRKPDVVDEHYYLRPTDFERQVHLYDNYSRTGPKIFVGEWASIEGQPTPNLHAALGDAAWMTGVERNSDIVVMEAYAPLLCNVNTGATQWPTNLIGFNARGSFGSPSYYVLQLFGSQHGNQLVHALLEGQEHLYQSVTRDDKTGTVYVKLVNINADAQPVDLTLAGASGLAPEGTATVLTGDTPASTNSIDRPENIVPVATVLKGVGPTFRYTLAPYSVTVLQLKTQ